MKKFFIFVPVQTMKRVFLFVLVEQYVEQYKHHVRSIAQSGVSPGGARSERSPLMPSRTDSSNLHVI